MGRLNAALHHRDELFVLFTPLGILGEPELGLVQKRCKDHFEIRSAKQMPQAKELDEWQRKMVTKTGLRLDSHAALGAVLGFERWPEFFIVENVEALSEDQALTLKGCIGEHRCDRSKDWPDSIVLVLKDGTFPHADFRKYLGRIIN